MNYSYEQLEELLKDHLDSMWRDPDDLCIGENISDVPEIKIIFDGYADLETEDENGEYVYKEGGDTNQESYAIFIHKDSHKEDFQFPEHEMTPWGLIHRPQEEVCLYAWYNVEKDYWDILPLEDRLDDCVMTEKEVMYNLEVLHERYFKPWENPVIEYEKDENGLPVAKWPFPTK